MLTLFGYPLTFQIDVDGRSLDLRAAFEGGAFDISYALLLLQRQPRPAQMSVLR